jgi:hypothetical protein
MKFKEISIFTKSALAAAIVGAITFAPSQLDVADAAALGRVTATTSFSSATFRLHATTTVGGAITGTSLVLSNTNARQYFYLINTGSLSLDSFTLAVTGSANNSSFTFRRCETDAVFTGNNDCSTGVPIAVTVTSDVAIFNVPAGATFHIQLTPSKTTTPTINISVARSQARAATSTNS